MPSRPWNLGIGLLFVMASAIALIWWIPADTESGVLVQDRYSVEIGDAMAPTMSAIAILIIALAMVVRALLSAKADGADDEEAWIGLTRGNMIAMAAMAAISAIAMVLMYWAGPVAVETLRSLGMELKSYRLLSDTIPYKYIGFTIGGVALVSGLIAWIEGHVSRRALWIGLCAVAALIVIYDVPFDTLLLPPNGSH